MNSEFSSSNPSMHETQEKVQSWRSVQGYWELSRKLGRRWTPEEDESPDPGPVADFQGLPPDRRNYLSLESVISPG